MFSATMIKKTEDFTLNSVFLREEFDLDDLFNLFFEQNTRTRARRFNTRSQHQTHQQNPQFSLLSLLPIIFMLMFFMGLFTSDPEYSLHRNNKYPNENKSYRLGIVFFTQKPLRTMSQRDQNNINREVELSYFSSIEEKCLAE